jgi:hypothetical protein
MKALLRPIPDQFSEDSHLTNLELRLKYQAGDKLVARWRRELSAQKGHSTARKETPADIASHNGLSHRDVGKIYGVSPATIARWRSELGIPTPTRIESNRVKAALVPSPPPAPVFVDKTRAEGAAQFLRPYYRPVYHREIEDKKLKGTYVVGRQIMNAADMVKLAEEKGFSLRAY